MKKESLRLKRSRERGNVLFLILIAVALFAALSYAVTSSSRSGGGDANDENALVNSASLTQYPAAVRTAIVRQLVSKGVSAEELAFNKPPYDDLDTATTAVPAAVFHPQGGGSVYSPSSADVMADGEPGDWYFNANFRLEQIGLDANNDIIAFLPEIKKSICEKINSELGIGAPLTVNANLMTDIKADMVDDDSDIATAPDNYAATGGTLITDGATPNGLAGFPYGCFINGTGGEYVYFHVLVEQ